MRNNPKIMSIWVGLLQVFFVGAAVGEAVDSSKTEATNEVFVIETRHRLFRDFRQVDTVRIGEIFLIGEEELKAEVQKFNPDFAVSDSGEYLQITDTLYNPAVYVRLTMDDGRVQESWGFYYMDAPHYRRDNLFGFKLVDFRVSEKYIKPPEKK